MISFSENIMKQMDHRLLKSVLVVTFSAIIILVLSFLASVFSASQIYAQTVSQPERFYRDSVYCRVINEGSTSLSCYLSYPQGGSFVLRDYGNNSYELAKLGEFIRAALSDTLIYVRSVRVSGYSSVDGIYSSNELLARKRSLGFRDFLFQEYPFLKRYGITTDWVGEDWEKLRSLVAASDINERDEILQIIDKVDVFSGREKLLMDLNGGAAYRNMEKLFFPLLRRVELTVEYDLHRIIEDRYQRKLTEEEFLVLLEQERTKARFNEERLKKELEELKAQRMADSMTCARVVIFHKGETSIRKKHAILGLSTNLYSLCGFTLQAKRTTFMPNVGIEYFAFRHWSLAASALYSSLDFGQDEFWGISAYTVEPRFWINGNGKYRGFYLGLYGRAGDFDIRRSVVEHVTTDNQTGTYYEGGASLGYVLPLSRRWYLEAGVSGGYRNVKAKVYDVEQSQYYFVRNESESRMRLTDIRFSVGYRLGNKSSK